MRFLLIILLLAVSLAAILAAPKIETKIIGGSLTTISQYPFACPLLYSRLQTTFWQSCAGTIITRNAVLTAAHCVIGDVPAMWRIRVGSTYANSGGTVHILRFIINHYRYSPRTLDHDVAVLRSESNVAYIPNTVAPATIAGSNYNLADNQAVWAIGWGRTAADGAMSEQLRHVQIWSINHAVCKSRYAELGATITDNMLCSGWLDVGGRDQCQGDSGGPLIHYNVIVGISSWGHSCAHPRYPGVNARVSSFTSWIQDAAA